MRISDWSSDVCSSDLKGLEAAVSMDDFGTGFSNLASLQSLPIDILKIDRSFVTPMLQDKDKGAIVRAILSLAKSLNLKTTAEGIECAELAQALADYGCMLGQGFYFAQPMSAQEAYEFWLSRNRSEEHTSELQSLMRTSYAVICLKEKITNKNTHH